MRNVRIFKRCLCRRLCPTRWTFSHSSCQRRPLTPAATFVTAVKTLRSRRGILPWRRDTEDITDQTTAPFPFASSEPQWRRASLRREPCQYWRSSLEKNPGFLSPWRFPSRRGGSPHHGCCSHMQVAFQGKKIPQKQIGSETKETFGTSQTKHQTWVPPLPFLQRCTEQTYQSPRGTRCQGGMSAASRQWLEPDPGWTYKPWSCCVWAAGRLQSISYPCWRPPGSLSLGAEVLELEVQLAVCLTGAGCAVPRLLRGGLIYKAKGWGEEASCQGRSHRS